MLVLIDRSDEYCRSQAVALGNNVPSEIKVDVDPQDLSPESRAAIVAVYGQYPETLRGLCYERTSGAWAPHRVAHVGTLKIDAEPAEITPRDIDAAIAAIVAARQTVVDAWEAGEPERIAAQELEEREDRERAAQAAQREQERVQREKAEAEERAQWISEHGSARLQRLVAEDIEHDNLYYAERLAHDRPGWRYESDVPGDARETRNTRQSGLDLLDEARKTDEHATLAWWVITADCDYGDREVVWKGYACQSAYLGRDIIYGVPDKFA